MIVGVIALVKKGYKNAVLLTSGAMKFTIETFAKLPAQVESAVNLWPSWGNCSSRGKLWRKAVNKLSINTSNYSHLTV